MGANAGASLLHAYCTIAAEAVALSLRIGPTGYEWQRACRRHVAERQSGGAPDLEALAAARRPVSQRLPGGKL